MKKKQFNKPKVLQNGAKNYSKLTDDYHQNSTALPKHLQRYCINSTKHSYEYFSVLQELTIRFVGPMEAMGYTIEEKYMPDISVGRMFADYLRSLGYDLSGLPSYEHEFIGERRLCYPRLYPMKFQPMFVKFFYEEWLWKRAYVYFQQRDPSAIPYLDKLN